MYLTLALCVNVAALTIQKIYERLAYSHPKLKPIDVLVSIEVELEREMLVSVVSTLEKVERYRNVRYFSKHWCLCAGLAVLLVKKSSNATLKRTHFFIELCSLDWRYKDW